MEAARDGGIIESVVSMLRSSRHEDETEAALEAVAWLAKGNRVNQTAFVKAGVLSIVAAGLMGSPTHRQSAAWVVATAVERNTRNQVIAGEGELVTQLIGVLSASAPARTLQLALKALMEIVRGNEANCTAAVRCGAVTALRAILRRQRTRAQAPSRLQVAAKDLLLEMGVDVDYEAQMTVYRSRHFGAVLLVLVAVLCAMVDPGKWREVSGFMARLPS
eukprot:CAMPEP_0119515190 /NCGR_PEP_ID=MMETSP1344-20130328/32761_1 /TAXON_ID=236787 /ORGANISM="Florenciella parvula, Strain CCMP2471" /LENGTH=218 /DNA_ID=CAMNT_0007552569 /DNA_START=78 /DNA_END=734 /DNA_ORIENTATION=-